MKFYFLLFGWMDLENVTEVVTQTIRQGCKPQLLYRYKDPINEGLNVWYSLDPVHLLEEAIALLRELLDLEPDSKCNDKIVTACGTVRLTF